MSNKWFVARTKTGGEVRAAVAVANCGFEVFLPVHLVARSHAGKREQVSRPLYPRYLFVRFDAGKEAHGCINNCRGVANRGLIVDANGLPMHIPDPIIARIRGDEAARLAKAGEITTGYQPGDTFEIVRGNADITVAYLGEEKGTVMVIMTMLGKGNILPLDFSEVPPKKLIDARAA